MVLICSHGHKYNTDDFRYKHRVEGQRCGMLLSYDRLAGSTYCGRKLFNIEKKVNELYDRMFIMYYNGNTLNNWHGDTFFGGGNKQKYIDKINELLLSGKKVKTGYRTSSMIRGGRTYYIFSK